jgi:hypothetical protein
LPERRTSAREAGHQHGVEAADVDAELQRVGGRQPGQLAGPELALQLAAFLGQVAAPVGRDLRRQRRIDLREELARGERDLLGAPAGPDEGQGPDVLGDEVGEQVGGLGRRGSAQRSAVLAGELGERRLPHRQRHLAAR